jgi:hypothetical protein
MRKLTLSLLAAEMFAPLAAGISAVTAPVASAEVNPRRCGWERPRHLSSLPRLPAR